MIHVRSLGSGADLWCCVLCHAEVVALDVDVAGPAPGRARRLAA